MHLVRAREPEFMSLWNDLRLRSGCLDALYGAANLSFYREYSGHSDAEEVSILVAIKNEPICGAKIFRSNAQDGSVELSCFGLPIIYVERSEFDRSLKARAQRLLRTEMDAMLQALPTGSVTIYRDRLHEGCLSILGRMLLDIGGEATPSFTQIIDLSSPVETLHSDLTKAYKWAVNWGKKNLSLYVFDQDSLTLDHIEQFRLLHVESAGRETRTRVSWKLQYDMVQAGEAFCVFAYIDETLVSAALFPHSRAHCYYGVSASRRALFDRPLSHSIIWCALLRAKALHLRDFEMGEQLFPMATRRSPSKKELGISFFKRAFGGNAKVALDIRLRSNGNTKLVALNPE